jgi:hypothetical protein
MDFANIESFALVLPLDSAEELFQDVTKSEH